MRPGCRSTPSLHDHTLDLLCRQWTTHDRRRLAAARHTCPRPSARHDTIWESIQEALHAERLTTPFAA